MRRFAFFLVLCSAVALGTSACKEEEQVAAQDEMPPVGAGPPADETPLLDAFEPFRVSDVEIGSALGPDKRAVAAGGVFAPTDTIYASVASEGTAPAVTLGARWTSEDGTVVHEESQIIEPNGATVSEFHVAKPDGWAPGRYRVEISADGAVVGSEDFAVE